MVATDNTAFYRTKGMLKCYSIELIKLAFLWTDK